MREADERSDYVDGTVSAVDDELKARMLQKDAPEQRDTNMGGDEDGNGKIWEILPEKIAEMFNAGMLALALQSKLQPQVDRGIKTPRCC